MTVKELKDRLELFPEEATVDVALGMCPPMGTAIDVTEDDNGRVVIEAQ